MPNNIEGGFKIDFKKDIELHNEMEWLKANKEFSLKYIIKLLKHLWKAMDGDEALTFYKNGLKSFLKNPIKTTKAALRFFFGKDDIGQNNLQSKEGLLPNIQGVEFQKPALGGDADALQKGAAAFEKPISKVTEEKSIGLKQSMKSSNRYPKTVNSSLVIKTTNQLQGLQGTLNRAKMPTMPKL